MTCSRFLAILLVGIISFQQAIALMCWHCDSVQNDYCGEPFTGKNLTNPSTYVECRPKDFQSKSVCVKAKVKPTGVTIRQCAGSDDDAQRVCNFGLYSAEYCETCDQNGCNMGARLDPIAIPLVAVPALIATISTLTFKIPFI